MAEEFCRALLQTSNIVPSSDTEDQDCIICLQETGKMNRETGLVELKIRLPCEHVVGSGCIAVWLRTNNSCPLCRRVFFRAHEEQYLEDINEQNQEEEYQDEEDRWEDQEEEEEIEDMLLINCRIYSIQLRLDSTTIRIAQAMIQIARRIYPICDSISTICDYNAVRLVGMAIYIASSLTGHPRSPREICGVRDVDDHIIRDEHSVNGDDIRDFYHLIYDQRRRLINNFSIIESLEGRDRVWPSVDPNDESDDHIEISRDLLAVRAHCVNECAHLQAPPLMVDLAQHIAANVIRAGFHSFSHPEDSEHLSESEITGVSIYIASHLLSQPLPRRSLQAWIGNPYPDIRSTCIIVRDKCDPLVTDDFRGTRGIQVSWESLEADVGEESADGRHENQEEEDATRIEATSVVTRTQRLMDLCGIYGNRLRIVTWTTMLAQRLSERFGSFKMFDDRRLESIAAACVYIACFCTNHHLRYGDILAMTGVSISSMYTTHLMMAQEIMLERINVQDIAASMGVEAGRIRNTLLPNTLRPIRFDF